MNREHHKWHSPNLGRQMDLVITGHAGAKVLVFPTSKGKFYEWEDRGMFGPRCLGPMIERGWLQIYSVDSVDAESWYNYRAHPGQRAWRNTQYFEYILQEVFPLAAQKNPNNYWITVGASFGAFHSATFALRYPHLVGRTVSMSGLYDIREFTGGYADDNVYFNNPMQFIANEHDPARLASLRNLDIIIATGRDDSHRQSSEDLSNLLWRKGIGNALRLWDGWSHDWPYWENMLKLYIGGHD